MVRPRQTFPPRNIIVVLHVGALFGVPREASLGRSLAFEHSFGWRFIRLVRWGWCIHPVMRGTDKQSRSWEFSMKNVENWSKYTYQSTRIDPKHFSGYYHRWWVAALLWQRNILGKSASLNFLNSCSGVFWLWEKIDEKRTSVGTSGWMGVDVGGQQIFGGGGGGSDSSILPVIGEMRKLRKIISWELWMKNQYFRPKYMHQSTRINRERFCNTVTGCRWLCGCGGGSIWWMSGSRSGRTAGFRGLGCQWHNVKYWKNGSSDGKSGWIAVNIEGWRRCF